MRDHRLEDVSNVGFATVKLRGLQKCKQISATKVFHDMSLAETLNPRIHKRRDKNGLHRTPI